MILLSAAVAILLAKNLNANQQNTLANFLMLVGQNISSGAEQAAKKEARDKLKENETPPPSADGISPVRGGNEKNKTKDGNAQ